MQTLLPSSVESLISVKLTADLAQFEHRSRQHTVYATLTTIECSTLKSGAVPVSVVNTSCAVRNLKFRREFRPVFSSPFFVPRVERATPIYKISNIFTFNNVSIAFVS